MIPDGGNEAGGEGVIAEAKEKAGLANTYWQ